MDAALGAQPAVGAAAVDGHRRALEARLLALLLVDDLGLQPMPLGPAQVHPEEHLGPVGGLGAARAGADREDRAARVVLAREQEQRSARARSPRPGPRRRGRARPRARRRACRRASSASSAARSPAFSSPRQRRSRRGGRRPRAGPSGRRAGHPRSRVRRRSASSSATRRSLASRSKPPRGRPDPLDEVPDGRGIQAQFRTWRSWSRIGRSSISRRAVLLRATTGFTQGQ